MHADQQPTPPTPPRLRRARAVLVRWEAIAARRQLLLASAAIFLVLAVAHLGLVAAFHRITVVRAVLYAFLEAPVLALAVVFATQVEVHRKRAIEHARRSAGRTTPDQ